MSSVVEYIKSVINDQFGSSNESQVTPADLAATSDSSNKESVAGRKALHRKAAPKGAHKAAPKK
jgi:hypothetical protein